MRGGAAVLILATGCYHARIAPALAARAGAVTPGLATDGTITFFEYRVEQVVGPRVETWPHPVAAGLEEHGVRYRYTLRAPDGDLEVRCDVGKQGGSLFTEPYASIVCEMRGYTIVVSGYGDTDFLDLRRVDGSVHADASSAPKPDPRVPTYFSDRLRVEGSGKLWNLYRSREIHHLDHDAVWRSSCCEDVEPLAAVALRPPRILFDPTLVAPLRLQAALAAAALLVLRDQRELVGSD